MAPFPQEKLEPLAAEKKYSQREPNDEGLGSRHNVRLQTTQGPPRRWLHFWAYASANQQPWYFCSAPHDAFVVSTREKRPLILGKKKLRHECLR